MANYNQIYNEFILDEAVRSIFKQELKKRLDEVAREVVDQAVRELQDTLKIKTRVYLNPDRFSQDLYVKVEDRRKKEI